MKKLSGAAPGPDGAGGDVDVDDQAALNKMILESQIEFEKKEEFFADADDGVGAESPTNSVNIDKSTSGEEPTRESGLLLEGHVDGYKGLGKRKGEDGNRPRGPTDKSNDSDKSAAESLIKASSRADPAKKTSYPQLDKSGGSSSSGSSGGGPMVYHVNSTDERGDPTSMYQEPSSDMSLTYSSSQGSGGEPTSGNYDEHGRYAAEPSSYAEPGSNVNGTGMTSGYQEPASEEVQGVLEQMMVGDDGDMMIVESEDAHGSPT